MTNNTDTKRLQSFLDQFRLIKEKHDDVARANGEWFNVFSVLGVESAEIRHSAFLAELLNPNGSHSQGAVFLRLFFEMLRTSFGKKFNWELSLDEIGGFEVTAEAHQGDYGRIDILIKTCDKCMVIENKIYAGDQERQLGRYYDYAKANWSEANIAVIYLTLDGKEPDNHTLYGNETRDGSDLIKSEYVLCVSYKHIIDWLDDCLKETVRIAHIRETLFQYQSLLKQLTGQTLNRRFIMDTNVLFSKPENHQLVPELEQAILEYKCFVQKDFWVKLKKEIERHAENGVRFVEYGKMQQANSVDWWFCDGEDFRNVVRKYVDKYKNYGLAIFVKKIDSTHSIFLSIRPEGTNPLYYCFHIVKDRNILNMKDVEQGKFADYKSLAEERIKGWIKYESNPDNQYDWWQFGYGESKVKGASAPNKHEEFVEFMGTEQKRKEIAENVSNEIKELLCVIKSLA